MLRLHADREGFDESHVGLELGKFEKRTEGELPQNGKYFHGEKLAVNLGSDRFEHVECGHLNFVSFRWRWWVKERNYAPSLQALWS